VNVSAKHRPARARLFLVSLFLLIGCAGLAAQQQLNRRPDNRTVRYGDLFYAGAVVFPGEGSVQRVDVLMRVEYDFLVFVRSNASRPDSLFRAIAVFNVEAVNDRGKHVRFRLARDTVYAGDYEKTNTRRMSLARRITLSLEPGTYRLMVWVEDGESERKKEAVLSLQVPSGEGVLYSALPVEVDTAALAGGRLTAIGYGSSVHFAKPSWIALTQRSVREPEYSCRLYQVNEDGERVEAARWNPRPVRVFPSALKPDEKQALGYFLEPDSMMATVLFALPFTTQYPGQYELLWKISYLDGMDSLRTPVRVLWKDIPFSLRDLDMAVKMLALIAPEDTVDRIASGSPAEVRKKLYAFWKPRDPDPATPYNPALAVFYRRVDEAYFRFRSLTNQNGAKTDRGRIFILKGEPDEIQRNLLPDEPPEEIWVYRDLGRRYVFVDISRNGSYLLKRVEEL